MSFISPFVIFNFIFSAFFLFFIYKLEGVDRIDRNDIKAIEELSLNFSKNTIPSFQLDFYGPKNWQRILELSYQNKRILTLVNCSALQPTSSTNFSKSLIWMERFCGKRTDLPSNFFETFPFVDKDGQSFVFKAFKSKIKVYQSKKWLEQNLKFAKFEELSLFGIFLSSELEMWANSTIKERESIIRGKDYIKMGNYLAYKVNEKQYNFYLWKQFKTFFNMTNYKINASNNECLDEDKGFCWSKYLNSTELFVLKYGWSIFIFALLLSMTSVFLWLKRQIELNKIKREKDFAFQLLTHELRTPIASILLKVDKIFNKESKISRELEADLLEIESQIYRLKRLSIRSQKYLNLNSEIEINRVKIDFEEIKHFINSIIAPVIIEGSWGKDFESDPFWLFICIENLCKNALLHGKAPYRIIFTQEEDTFYFTIEDHGNYKKEYNKKSEGLGVGLTLVKHILEYLNGELLFRKKPTQFTLKLKKVKL